MGKDTTAFRERFNAYKNGKPVSEIYDAGLPRYAEGTELPIEQMMPYILAVENPTKQGLANGIWRPPTDSSKWDTHAIGGGLDIREENNPIVYNYLKSKGRLNNPYLTVAEEEMLRKQTFEKTTLPALRKMYGKYKDKISEKGYARLAGMKWQGHPYLMAITPDSITGKAFLNAVASGDRDLDSVFDAYYKYPANAKRYGARINADVNYWKNYSTSSNVEPKSELVQLLEQLDKEKFLPLSNYHSPDYSLSNPAPSTISSWNNPTSPAFNTSGLYARRATNNINNVVQDILFNDKDVLDALMNNLSKNVFGGRRLGFKNGKLPGYKWGTQEWDKDDSTEKAKQWADDWLFRLTPAAGSKVVLLWNATGNKPEPESAELYTLRRIKQTEWKKPSGRKMLEMAPVAVDFVPGSGDVKQGLEATAAGLRGDYLEASLLGGGLLIPNAIENILKPAAKKYINAYKLSKAMKVDENKIDPISRSFRNLEWSNFLSTVNGDNYYRMIHRNERLDPNLKYFMSHTTPWEEFSGLGSEYNTGIRKLYEFPTNTFGRLRSSSDTGVYSDDYVIDMGIKHLLYGDTSSGFRGPVKILSDDNAAILGMEPTKIGISERPMKSNGFYDSNPTYENIRMGNQTVVRGRRLKDVISNAQHYEYYPTKNGVQKILYYPNGQFQKYGVTPDWRNPINNALSVLQQDKMLGEYIGHGAERQVFSDRRNPGRVIKIGGGLNGELNIQNFDQLRDAVEYTMEMNKLPGVAPISYEGFIDEKGTLIPWFSQKRVIPMNKIADPFYTFSKPTILPNGKPITKGKLSAIRNIDYEKLLGPLGYKDSPNGFVLSNYPYTVRDLGLKNIGFDLNGNVKIFDPLIDL